MIIDLMPVAPNVLGFFSMWYKQALKNSEIKNFNKTDIKVITLPYFIVTKLEALQGRGNGDYYSSKDIEDLIALFAEKPKFPIEINSLEDDDLKEFIKSKLRMHVANSDLKSAVNDHLPRDTKISAQQIILDLEEAAET